MANSPDTYISPAETGFYYLNSRYYDPEVGRFLSADGQISGVGGEILGYNMFAYCMNNPVNMSDPTGNWPKWLTGTLNIIGGALQAAAGGFLGVTVGWTGIGAVAAGVLIVNGAATMTQGIGQVVNYATKSNTLSENHIVKTSIQTAGHAIGGNTGAKIASDIYNATIIAATIYAGVTVISQNIPSASATNSGVPFQPGIQGFQYGVDPNTLTPVKDLATLNPQRMANAVKYGINQSIRVGLTGRIYDGHHRVANAIKNGRTIDIFVESYK